MWLHSSEEGLPGLWQRFKFCKIKYIRQKINIGWDYRIGTAVIFIAQLKSADLH